MVGADTAWILTSTALVLLMTLPGLSLFYAGLVRSKNAISVLMQCFAIACIVSVAWVVYGYSLAFTDGDGGAALYVAGVEDSLAQGIERAFLPVGSQLYIPEETCFPSKLA